MLYAGARVYGAVSEPDAGRDVAVGTLAVGTFVAVSAALYVDRPWVRPLWRACRAESGRDWMLNSGVLRLDWRRAGVRAHLFAVAAFLAYPGWFALGVRHGRRRPAT